MQRKAAQKGVELANAEGVRKAFKQVEGHINGLLKVMQHNSQVVQMGFYKNDIWLETFRTILSDIAETVEAMCRGTTVHSAIRMTEESKLDVEDYWNDASETVKRQVEQANDKKAVDGTPSTPLIARADDEKPIIFGGSYENDECASAREEAEGRDSGGEGQHEVRDATDSLPSMSEPSVASSPT